MLAIRPPHREQARSYKTTPDHRWNREQARSYNCRGAASADVCANTTHKASSIKLAEAAKVIGNTQRGMCSTM
ncbi:MAG: hypothetical protein Q8M11_14980 [Sulfuritalea sp.]|nr:hypothetical protein [Sulfuritalea sp.]